MSLETHFWALKSKRALQMREKVNEAVLLGFQEDPEFISRSLATLNCEAVTQCKAGDYVAAVVALCKLFERAKRKNLIHPEMYVCTRSVLRESATGHALARFSAWCTVCRLKLRHSSVVYPNMRALGLDFCNHSI